MRDPLVIDVDDLVGQPAAVREFSGSHPVSLRLADVTVEGPMTVAGTVTGTIDGVLVDFDVSAPAHFSCVRCLIEWDEDVVAEGTQHFGRAPDEDGYRIVDRTIDVSGPALDELALGLPLAPICREGCKGLCPVCGTDLNIDPCDGHGDDSDSPFTVLKDLFDPD